MAEDKVAPLDKRELAFREKIANLFPDAKFQLDGLPLEGRRLKAKISKRRSADGIIDNSPTTTADGIIDNSPTTTANVSQDTLKLLEADGEGTIFRSNSNVKRQKALISKNKTSASRIIDCRPTTYECTKVPPEAWELLESDEEITRGTIFKSNPSVNSESPFPNPFNNKPSPNPPSAPRRNTESSNSGCLSPQQQKHTLGIMHYCEICRVHCSGANCFQSHLRGQKHKAKLQLVQLSGDSNVEKRNKQLVRCDLCNIFCQDETLLELHLNGQKHKDKQLGLKHSEQIKDEDGQPFWCELCKVPCTNIETFALHLKGKKHIQRLNMS